MNRDELYAIVGDCVRDGDDWKKLTIEERNKVINQFIEEVGLNKPDFYKHIVEQHENAIKDLEKQGYPTDSYCGYPNWILPVVFLYGIDEHLQSMLLRLMYKVNTVKDDNGDVIYKGRVPLLGGLIYNITFDKSDVYFDQSEKEVINKAIDILKSKIYES